MRSADDPTDWADPEPLSDNGSARWGVSGPAALAAIAATVVVVIAVAAFVLLRPSPSGEPVAVRDQLPLATTSAVVSEGAQPAFAGTSPPAPSAGQVRVYVVGQVRRPGVVSLAEGARVEDAVDEAGGATGQADLTVINLARKVQDGEQIVVPKPGESVAPAPGPDPAAGSADPAATGSAPGAPVDLNTATVGQLDALPGVGPVIAARIIAWRQQNGGFSTVDDLGEVQGIGDATLEKLRPMVRV